jgi:GNAT superfamily N-acetyltransferase
MADKTSSAGIAVRHATASDLPLILRFIRKKAEFDRCPDAVEATEEKLRATLFSDTPRAHVLFAEMDGVAVGFAAYFTTYSTFLARPGIWLDDLFVDGEMRSQGIGEALMRHLARLAEAQGCGRIEWTAGAHNLRGIAFYRRLGAQVRENARLCRLDQHAIAQLAAEANPSRTREE